MENTPPRNPVVTIQNIEYDENSYVPVNDPNYNIFGERLPDTGYEEENIKMSDFSSI